MIRFFLTDKLKEIYKHIHRSTEVCLFPLGMQVDVLISQDDKNMFDIFIKSFPSFEKLTKRKEKNANLESSNEKSDGKNPRN